MADPFNDARTAALALLCSETRLTRQAGSFLGQIAVDSMPLTERQASWLDQLLDRAGLPPMEGSSR